jgi:hypothetical protein
MEARCLILIAGGRIADGTMIKALIVIFDAIYWIASATKAIAESAGELLRLMKNEKR